MKGFKIRKKPIFCFATLNKLFYRFKITNVSEILTAIRTTIRYSNKRKPNRDLQEFLIFYNFFSYRCLNNGNVTEAPYLPYVPKGVFDMFLREIRNFIPTKLCARTIVRSDPKFIFVLQKDRELKQKDLFMMALALFALSAFMVYVYNSFLV